MSIAIISDVHGNRHALDAVLAEISARGCSEIWSLGDLVGYGADPDACVSLARRHATVSLAGNHDMAVTGVLDAADFSDNARIAAIWTRENASSDTLDYLGRLHPSDETREVGLYHASPRDPIWEYVLSPLQADACLNVQSARVSLIGHSHVALSFWRLPDGSETAGSTRGGGERIDLAAGQWLLNPGSVGQPRDGDPQAAWLELDVEQWAATFHRVQYDIEGAAAAIRNAGLPASLGDRLRFGQ